ncbi:hypothetical protein MLD38_013082 [Melastoma candidum]|uniref:Uncharacterized protein n=1 Tax=Melastoma candidum TaxID=119954 RepID=A0ACB9R8D6_9MYRT|nr:hypothetical protein MLD38_013082 [Melastoma candidum]
MLDSLFAKAFKASKCKTLLKLTIPRIKLLRNRREIQIKQMRRDIAKLLETGQEATARIRVEHIIREEKMTAAQEILELFCELIVVRLPIIEAQRDCPLDLKEAISSVCFAAPRCADLPELLQVQISFASKYGKEFAAAATELMPDCGVNRQLIELLSVRAPSPDVKLKLLKDIAEEHELDWDPTASENELFKPHEDLLNGPTQFGSGSKVPLPKEKHVETSYYDSDHTLKERPGSETFLQMLDFPEVPMGSVRSNLNSPQVQDSAPYLPASIDWDVNDEPPQRSPSLGHDKSGKDVEKNAESKEVKQENIVDYEYVKGSLGSEEGKQFVPFIAPPQDSPGSFSAGLGASHSPFPSTKNEETTVDLQDVLTAAHAAAETAERAAAAARSAASLAQMRISELTTKSVASADSGNDNPFHADYANIPDGNVDYEEHQIPLDDHDKIVTPANTGIIMEEPDPSSIWSSEVPKFDSDSPDSSSDHNKDRLGYQRSTSMEDDSYFSYPNLFSSQNSIKSTTAQPFSEHARSHHEP